MEKKDVKFSDQDPEVDINTDENVAGDARLREEMELEDGQIEKLQEELQSQKEKYLRLFAEFDNYRKRNAREQLELRQTAGREVIVSLLDVLDDCDRAEKELQKRADNGDTQEGVLLVFNKLRSVLQNRGLKIMESLHQPFDVEKHEAIAEIPASSPELKGKVVDELMKGYYLNDKIIRFAKVIVGK